MPEDLEHTSVSYELVHNCLSYVCLQIRFKHSVVDGFRITGVSNDFWITSTEKAERDECLDDYLVRVKSH